MTKIMIVDDDRIDRMLMRRALETMDGTLELVEFDNGAAALEAFPTVAPDATLLDVRMPGLDGFEVLASLRSQAANDGHPVIMVSGSRQRQEVLRAHRDGATAYFPKPDTVAGYNDLVREIGDTWLPKTQPVIANLTNH